MSSLFFSHARLMERALPGVDFTPISTGSYSCPNVTITRSIPKSETARKGLNGPAESEGQLDERSKYIQAQEKGAAA